jgi:hypothetical protein
MRKKKERFNQSLEEISEEQLRRQKKKRLRKAFEARIRTKSIQKRNNRFEE